MASDYDLSAAFKAIEDELTASMIRNLKRHRAEETKEGYEWSMWQVEQLKALEKYKKENQAKYKTQFDNINAQIEAMIYAAKEQGGTDQEQKILRAMKKGFTAHKASRGATAEFFKLNKRMLESLVKATVDDMKRAETAVLRMANDQYRKIIYNAQVYANTGAGTYEKAVDMATKDFLKSGINCIEYANGSRHTIADYADMAIRTAGKRAYLQGEGEKRKEWGISTVIVNKRGNPCPKCLPHCGKVYIDDVWSGGPKSGISPMTGIKYPLLSSAVAGGLYHPRCKDSHTTYFEGISTPPGGSVYTRDELNEIVDQYKADQRQRYAERQAEKYTRLEKYSLDPDNRKIYGSRAELWKHVKFRTGNISSGEYADSKRPLSGFKAVPKNQVVDVLRTESQKWTALLTDSEKNAIKKYTYNSGDKRPNRFFERLNGMLRGDIEENAHLRSYAEAISKAIKKNEFGHDIIAYRGMNIDPTEGMNPGTLFKPKQFFSTSVIESGSFEAKYKVIIYVKKGSSAAYIENLSYFKKQRELLLDKDCIYRILSKKENVIELEVI